MRHMKYDIIKQSRKKIPSKLWLSFCMEFKFDSLQYKLLICNYFGKKSYLHMTNKIIYRYEIWQMWHMTHATFCTWHKKHSSKIFFSKLWFSYCMECKFKYLQEKLLICHYFSKKSYLHLTEKHDNLHN